MALFGRREIQRRIDALANVAQSKQLETLVRRLNLTTRDALHAEWELAWLTAFNATGRVRIEPKFAGGTRVPDFHYSDGQIEFVADISTVSDEGLDDEYPVDALREALDELKRKHGLVSGGFRLNFPSHLEKAGDRTIPRVGLPPRPRIREFVKEHFGPFLRRVATDTEKRHRHAAPVTGHGYIVLEYDPTLRPYSQEGGHNCYDTATSLTDNSIYRCLRGKRNQLAGCGYVGLRGIIICDADCAALGRYLFLRSSNSNFSPEQIVTEFFRQHRSITFVVTVGIQSTGPYITGRGFLQMHNRVYFAPSTSEVQVKQLLRAIESAASNLPNALWTPENARHLLRVGSPPPADSVFVGWDQLHISDTMKKGTNSTSVTLPARTVIGLLTGKISPSDFEKRGHKREVSPPNILAECERLGMALKAVQLDAGGPDDDDDRITLVFEGHDAGKTRFRVPPAVKISPQT